VVDRFLHVIFNLKKQVMENFIKQCVGIDCAKDELVCCLSVFTLDLNVEVRSTQVFENTAGGIKKLITWAEKAMKGGHELYFAVEATGVYHELLAYTLTDEGKKVSVILPNKTSAHMRGLNMKTITDKSSAIAIADYGVKHKTEIWQKPDPAIRSIRNLMREKQQLNEDATIIKNQLHAERSSKECNEKTIARMSLRLSILEGQVKEIMAEARSVVSEDEKLERKIENICTIPGVGLHTALSVVGETFGFSLIKNSRQLVSYAGLDIRVKDSGSSVKSKPQISKKGNRHIRKALYFPALSAARYNPTMTALYARLVGKHGIKMKASVALQRKILVLIYTLWKNDQAFNAGYQQGSKKSEGSSLNPPTELVINTALINTKVEN
jgi:transposase